MLESPVMLKPISVRTLALLLALGLVAAACGSSIDTASIEGIDTNEGGITVKPPDVLDGETEVIDGQDTAPQPALVEEVSDVEPAERVSDRAAPDSAFPWFDVGDQVAFVGMNTSDRRYAADRLATQTGVTYPLAEDPDGTVFSDFEMFVLPATVFLDANGDVAYTWSGVLTDSELRILIQEHLTGSAQLPKANNDA